MAQSIMNPGRSSMPEKKDPLDTIMKGLQIAQAVYGIKTDMSKMDEYKKAQAAEQERMAAQTEETKANTGLIQAKVKSLEAPQKVTLADFSKMTGKNTGLRVGKGDEPDAIAVNVEGAKRYLVPRVETEKLEPVRATSVNYVDDEGNKRSGTKLYDRSGQSKFVKSPDDPIVERAKAAGEFEVPLIGKVSSEKEAKDLTGALEMYSNIKQGVQEMRRIRNRAGFGGFEVLNRGLVNEGKSASTQLQFMLKDLNKLGVLSGSDVEMLLSIVPEDPTALGAIDAKLDALEQNADLKVANGLFVKKVPIDKIYQITGQIPSLVKQKMTEAEAIAFKELMEEQASSNAGR